MFEVKGDMAQWRTIYAQLTSMRIDDVIRDEELARLLPDAPDGSIRSAFYRAMREMEDEYRRSFIRVRNTGYRMVDAPEHVGLAQTHHKRARRQLRTAWRKAHSADRSRLSQADRQRLDSIEMNLAQQREMTARLEAKVRMEIQARKAGEAVLSEKVDRLAALLERHGITEEAVEAA